ncbi:hypothetical protein CPB86DRAFT_788001 [Serendipita vermifera]|nr:hypothetical protein CPB86DRAFT_788001 [Serendipita vermifera]
MFTALEKELEGIINLQNNQSPGTYRTYGDINMETNEIPLPDLPPEAPPKVYALIIGIDKYRHPILNLTGAVADANEVEHYIRTNFPSSEILNLRNETATRSAIIQGIRSLWENPRIRHQDPILIYYAGHGAEKEAPQGWVHEGQKIQILMPQDYDNDETFITDIAFSMLLEELATKKGDNIVVILDCCHSGSMTRSDEEEGVPPSQVRSITIKKPLSDNVDQDILGEKGIRAAFVPKPFQFSGASSHVLLAACGDNEEANEDLKTRRGAFTQALLETMNRIDYRKLTYAGLIRNLPELPKFVKPQTPRCEGVNRDRFFFDPKPPRQGRTFHEVHVEEGVNVVVRAGAAHGVTKGAEFTLYPTADMTGNPIGSFRIRKLKAVSATLEVADISVVPSPAFALQTRIGLEDALRVCFAKEAGLQQLRDMLIRDMNAEDSMLERCIFVEKERAQVEVDVKQNSLIFNILNPLITSLGVKRLPYRIKLNRSDFAYNVAANVIRAAARFERYLNYKPETPVYHKEVEVEFLKVERKGRQRWGPPSQISDNLCRNNHVEIVAGPTLYGIKITNNSTDKLYPHLFLFDCSDLSIESYYRPPTVQKLDTAAAPLQPGGFLTIGYGTGGQNPWNHYVRDEEDVAKGNILQENQDLDIGIFKLFLTTEPADLSSIAQKTPFSDDFRGGNGPTVDGGDKWDAISTVVVVQRQRGLLNWDNLKNLVFSSNSSPTS